VDQSSTGGTDEGNEAARLRQALLGLSDAQRRVEEAEEQLHGARDEANRILRLFGARLASDGAGPPRDLIRVLYWDYPMISAREIALAFGIRSPGEVYQFAGPDVRSIPCLGGCGLVVNRALKNRSDLKAKPYSSRLDWRYCDECRALRVEEEAARQDEANRARRQREWEEQAILQRAIDEGLAEVDTEIITTVRFQGIRRYITENGDDDG